MVGCDTHVSVTAAPTSPKVLSPFAGRTRQYSSWELKQELVLVLLSGTFVPLSPCHSQMVVHRVLTAWDLSICPQQVFSGEAFLLELKGRG